MGLDELPIPAVDLYSIVYSRLSSNSLIKLSALQLVCPEHALRRRLGNTSLPDTPVLVKDPLIEIPDSIAWPTEKSSLLS